VAGAGEDGRVDSSWLARLVDFFLTSNTQPLLIAFSILAGVIAIGLTPREEEPQIVVPMADVHVEAPGLTAEEVERQVSTRLEKLFSQIDGVEHVYSGSYPGRAVVTVRFRVGEDRQESLLEIYDKLYSNTDEVPPAVSSWVVKPIEIDDVPIVIVTLWSDNPSKIDDFALRRLAEELELELKTIPQTNRTWVVGGRPREVRVELDTNALAARQTSPLEVAWALEVSNVRRRAGELTDLDRAQFLDAGRALKSPPQLEGLVVNVVDGIPVMLRDVATVRDGPAEPMNYSWLGFGPAAERAGMHDGGLYPAVHVAVAKQRGSNAVDVARAVEERLAEFATSHFPPGVHSLITRDYGETANDKVNELLESLAVATLIVIGLIAYTLGWREGLVVALAVPITFSLTLVVNYAAGYTINRVTLFALILSLGLVVDDPIVDVENIHRHLRLLHEPPLAAVRRAVNEVRPPILLATLAVIVSFLPMVFITGMMGPYMRPMALNVPIAMAMSMLVAFTITPWLAYHALRKQAASKEEPEVPLEQTLLYRLYARLLGPLLDVRRRAWLFLGGVLVLFGLAVFLVLVRAVPLKMLPFENRNELQVVVDAPEGTTLERTDAVTRRLASVLQRAPEVVDVTVYTGMASPMDFNGMVRHYFLRQGSNVADIRVKLAPKRKRAMQSHEIALRLRPELARVAEEEDVKIALVELPPGPPVLATLTGEIHGEAWVPYERYRLAAEELATRLRAEPGVSDVDTSVEADVSRVEFVLDQEKAALSGVAAQDAALTLELALDGVEATQLHVPDEVNPLPVRLRLPRSERASAERLAALAVKGRPGIAVVRDGQGVRAAPVPVVRLGEIGRFEQRPLDKAIYHKDLQRVAFVYAEAVGRAPAEIVSDLEADWLASGVPLGPKAAAAAPRSLGTRSYLDPGGGMPWQLPAGTFVRWFGEGELKITRDVFRDLGIAFGVALVGIYFIVVYQTASYAMPLILMLSIPLTMIGIMPGFWLLNLILGKTIGSYADPVFFTATAMIGMIALSGIAVRNAILLVEFLHVRLAEGLDLREAILHAGAVRMPAIGLTAGTAMLAALPIALDPIFSGLAWALIFGLLVSTAFTLFVVPLTYDLVYRHRPGHGLPSHTSREEQA